MDEICAKGGGDKFTGKFIDIANEFKVSTSSVCKIWRQYCESDNLYPKHGVGGGGREDTDEVYLTAIFS